jgi:hypothetical protein
LREAQAISGIRDQETGIRSVSGGVAAGVTKIHAEYHPTVIHAPAESLGFAALTTNLYRRWARHAVPLQRLSRLSRLKSVFI